MWILGFNRVKPSPKQAPTAPPGQVQPASSIDVIFPFAAANIKGMTQFLLSGDASKSLFAVVFPKNIPTGSNSKCSISTNFISITNHPFKFKFVDLFYQSYHSPYADTTTGTAVHQNRCACNCFMTIPLSGPLSFLFADPIFSQTGSPIVSESRFFITIPSFRWSPMYAPVPIRPKWKTAPRSSPSSRTRIHTRCPDARAGSPQ